MMTTSEEGGATAPPDKVGEPSHVPQGAAEHPVAIYLGRLRPASGVTMRSKLNAAAALLSGRGDAYQVDWAALTPGEVAGLRAALLERYSPATASVTLSAVRGVLRVCHELDLLDAARWQQLTAEPAPPRPDLLRGRCLSRDEVTAVFVAAADDPLEARGARDGALLVLLYGAGLRRAEAVGLDLAAVDLVAGTVTVATDAGRSPREVPCGAAVGQALGAWLERRGAGAGPLLLPIRKNGRLAERRMRPEAVRGILLRLAATAGLAAFTAEDLRHTWFRDLLVAGADLTAVQRLAGHSTLLTTLRLAARTGPWGAAPADLVPVPWRAAPPTPPPPPRAV